MRNRFKKINFIRNLLLCVLQRFPNVQKTQYLFTCEVEKKKK